MTMSTELPIQEDEITSKELAYLQEVYMLWKRGCDVHFFHPADGGFGVMIDNRSKLIKAAPYSFPRMALIGAMDQYDRYIQSVASSKTTKWNGRYSIPTNS